MGQSRGGKMVTFKKILFPTDFSLNANHALLHALRLADFQKGELIVLHVVTDYFEKHSHWSTLFDIHELQKYMDIQVAAEMAKVLPPGTTDVSVRKVISKGKPAEEIAALAEKELVDCIVMGSANGVITNKVIRLSNRPVLAVSSTPGLRDVASPRKTSRIMVSTDFSEHSKRIMRYAFELKRALGASLYMLYVIETPKVIEFGIKQGQFRNTMARMREWATNQLINLTPDEFINDDSVVRIVETGSPSDRIAEVAGEIGADLTILGTHEYGTLHKHLIGTTTDRLLTKSPVPVLTLKL
jgi:nucleotide-binding universal stress UspA family protein